MNRSKIIEIADEVGLVDKNKELFVEFFSKRFPEESDNITSYVSEWANRFKGDPTPFMDSTSLSIYTEVKNGR